MLNHKENQRAKERKLAYLLRHDTSYDFGNHGWREVSDLVENHGFSPDELISIVANSNKQRFEFSDDKRYIRARQGHSVDVDVELAEAEPPEFLYHGTVAENLKSIMELGLSKMKRQHVHLFADETTALKVGERHKGSAVVLKIAAQKMQNDGFRFFLSRNNVWLTEAVPTKYIEINNKLNNDSE